MTPLATFPWPTPPGNSLAPRWNAGGFEVDGGTSRVLSFATASSHWRDDLTALHETDAGRDHPIDLASRHLAVASMKKLAAEKPVILDVGCSSGFVLEDLRRVLPQAALIGADYLPGPLAGLAQRMPDIPILQFDLRQCPLPDACVDGITCLNVLEHIDDDRTALREMHRILKPGGLAHVEVPAGPELYDIYDEHLLHHRRYRLGELTALARQAGFTIEKASHLGFAVYPAFRWVKQRNRKKLGLPAAEKARLVGAQIRATRASRLFVALLKLELLTGRHLSYPWGIRCLCVLRKNPQPAPTPAPPLCRMSL